MSGNRSFWTTFYLWIRNLHLYFGLFVIPLVLVFAISTMMLNHNASPYFLTAQRAPGSLPNSAASSMA